MSATGVIWDAGGPRAQKGFMAKKALYLTGDKREVVDGTSTDAAYLLAGEGGHVTEETAKQYKLGPDVLVSLEDIEPLPNGERLLFANPRDEQELADRGFGLHITYSRGISTPTEFREMQDSQPVMDNPDILVSQGVPSGSPSHPMNVGKPGAMEAMRREAATREAEEENDHDTSGVPNGPVGASPEPLQEPNPPEPISSSSGKSETEETEETGSEAPKTAPHRGTTTPPKKVEADK